MRVILFLPLVAAAMSGVGVAEARERPSRLSRAEQQRIVCVQERDDAGGAVPRQVCQSGRAWELAVQRHRAAEAERVAEWRSRSTKAFYLASRVTVR